MVEMMSVKAEMASCLPIAREKVRRGLKVLDQVVSSLISEVCSATSEAL